MRKTCLRGQWGFGWGFCVGGEKKSSVALGIVIGL